MQIFDVMSADSARLLREQALAFEFECGDKTAGLASKSIKINKQLSDQTVAAIPFLNTVRTLVLKCEPLCVYALPRDLFAVMVNQYGANEGYGWHTDNPYMLGKRTDISFTLFLTNPWDYEGGELEIQRGRHTASIKGLAGQAVVYGTGDLHRVTPVTNGNRISAVGWMTSWVGNEADRELLFEMQQELARLSASASLDELRELSRIYQKLARRFSK